MGSCTRRARRARVIRAVAVAMVALFAPACRSPRVYQVGILSGLNLLAVTEAGFKSRMTELGYKEGLNIVYRTVKSDFDPVKERQAIEGFLSQHVDLIFVFPTEAAVLTKAVAGKSGTPIVFANANIEGVDLVASVREPGGNVTGVRYPGPAVATSRYQVLHALAPKAQRIWVPYQRGYPSVPEQLAGIRAAATADGVTLVETPLDGSAALTAEVQALGRKADPGVDAVLMISEPLMATFPGAGAVATFARSHRLPIGGGFIGTPDDYSLFGVSSDGREAGRLAAPIADKILRGIRAGTIPVVSADASIEINLGLATRLGLTVPEGLLRRASRVVH
jgi:putative tryptophan/tyrosine transport system substrate-binding protein